MQSFYVIKCYYWILRQLFYLYFTINPLRSMHRSVDIAKKKNNLLKDIEISYFSVIHAIGKLMG